MSIQDVLRWNNVYLLAYYVRRFGYRNNLEISATIDAALYAVGNSHRQVRSGWEDQIAIDSSVESL